MVLHGGTETTAEKCSTTQQRLGDNGGRGRSTPVTLPINKLRYLPQKPLHGRTMRGCDNYLEAICKRRQYLCGDITSNWESIVVGEGRDKFGRERE